MQFIFINFIFCIFYRFYSQQLNIHVIYQRTNRQNVQMGIKCTIGHSKLEIGNWGLGIEYWNLGWNRVVQAGLGWNILEQARIGRNRLEYAGKDWNRLEQTGIAENRLEQAGLGWNRPGFYHIPVYSSLFQPIPEYSPIPNPQSSIWNAQLSILSPIGNDVCQFCEPIKSLFLLSLARILDGMARLYSSELSYSFCILLHHLS